MNPSLCICVMTKVTNNLDNNNKLKLKTESFVELKIYKQINTIYII